MSSVPRISNGHNGSGLYRRRTPRENRLASRRQQDTSVFLNPIYARNSVGRSLATAFQQREDLRLANGASVASEPFTHCVLPDFLGSRRYVRALERAVKRLSYSRKTTDLCQLAQNDALENEQSGEILKISVEDFDAANGSERKFIRNTFRQWVSSVTGQTLEAADISASLYRHGDYFLCHNDKLEDRKIAFIYYLTPPNWDRTDGGLLGLFNECEDNPDKVVKTVLPKNNTMVLFEVTSYSYHQVSEILGNKRRYAIFGWFRGIPPIDDVDFDPLELERRIPQNHAGPLSRFLAPCVLNDKNIANMRASFKSDCHLVLKNFLRRDVYTTVAAELAGHNRWIRCGPANKRSYKELKYANLPPATRDLVDFLCSDIFLRFLSNIVRLQLFNGLPSNEGNDESDEEREESERNGDDENVPSITNSRYGRPVPAHYTMQVCKWGHRNYSLLYDYDERSRHEALDVILYFNCRGWNSNVLGGNVTYCDKNEVETVLEAKVAELQHQIVCCLKLCFDVANRFEEKHALNAKAQSVLTLLNTVAKASEIMLTGLGFLSPM